jgi:chromosome segregation ATPase
LQRALCQIPSSTFSKQCCNGIGAATLTLAFSSRVSLSFSCLVLNLKRTTTMSGWTADGWDEDDDVDLDDDEDIFVEDEHMPEEPSNRGVTTLGAGLFMGRLAQMISQVAAPQVDEQQQEAVAEELSKPQSLATGLSLLLAPSASDSGADGGWDDDLEGIDNGDGGWGDDDLDEIDSELDGMVDVELRDTPRPSPPATALTTKVAEPGGGSAGDLNIDNASQPHADDTGGPQFAHDSAGGWDDSLCLDDDQIDPIDHEAMGGTPKTRVPPPPPPVSKLSLLQAQYPPPPPPPPLPPPLPSNHRGFHCSMDETASESVGWDDPDFEDLDQMEDDRIQDMAERNPSECALNKSATPEAIGNGVDGNTGIENENLAVPSDPKPDLSQERIDDSDNAESVPHLQHRSTDNEPSDIAVAPDEVEQVAMQDYEASEEQGGWEDSALEGLDDFDRSRSTLSPLPAAASPLVDQVPLVEMPTIMQRDSTVAMASDQSGTLGEESYPDEEYYGPVVDQLPPPFRAVPFGAESILTQVRFEELDQDDNEVGEDTAPGETSEETTNGVNAGPILVDHVPAIPAARIRIRDSTLAVASEQSSTVMEDIWREDFAPNDEDYGPVVDHLPTPATPSPSVKSLRSMSSLAVQRAITEEENAEDEDAGELRCNIGVFSSASVADSMAVVAPIAEHDEDITFGQTVDGVDGDTLHDDETVSNAPLTTDGNNSVTAAVRDEPLVDHVPLQRGGNPTDASTLAFADPSEVSTVGDMTYEDMQYGLVVDHTPPPRQLTCAASGAASIAVALTKSECPDDLEDDMDGETYAMGTGDDAASLDTTLGEQNHPDDQLVDHVPEGPILRRINSASAIAEALSVISTRDDEFGLVVDHTPILAIGTAPLPRDSVGALATLSECETLRSDDIRSVPASVLQRRIEVDDLPASSNLSRGDSTFAIKSVGETVDADTIGEMSTVNEFGPVVDQLPFVATPIAASRGGSTAGALATLSEADFDRDSADADGWDDDDIQDGVTVGTASGEAELDEFKEETPETRNRSVTFQNPEGAPVMPLNQSSMSSELLRLRRSPYSTFDGEDDSNVGKSTNGSVSVESVECRACAETGSLDCPCIQRILAYEGDDAAAVVRRISPDGFPVDIDYSKLLQDEVTKRVILEKEVEKYAALVDSLRSCVSEKSVERVGDQKDIQRLESINNLLVEKLRIQEVESKSLQNQVQGLHTEIAAAHSRLEEVSSCRARDIEDAVQIAIGELKNKHERAVAEETNDHTRNAEERDSEIKRLQEENDSLHRQVLDVVEKSEALQSQFDTMSLSEKRLRDEVSEAHRVRSEVELRMSAKLDEKEVLASKAQIELNLALGKIRSLESYVDELSTKVGSVERDLLKANEIASRLASNESELIEKEQKYQTEISNLQQLIEEAASANDLEIHFKANIASLEGELKDRVSDVKRLNDKLKSSEIALREAEANNFAHIKESARLSKRHKVEIATLKKELSDSFKKCEIEVAARDATIAEGQQRLSSLVEDLRVVSESKDELKRKIQQLLAVVQEKSSLDSTLRRLTAENADLAAEIGRQGSRFADIKGDRDQLHETVVAYAEQIQQLQQRLNSYESHKNELERVEGRLLQIETEKEHLLANINVYKEQIKAVEEHLFNANEQCQSLYSQSSEQRLMIDSLTADLKDQEEALRQKELRLNELEPQLSSISLELASVSKERDDLSVCRDEHERTIAILLAKEKDLLMHSKNTEKQMNEALTLHSAEVEERRRRDEIEGQLRADLDHLLLERDTILNEMRQHEEDSEDMLVQLGLNKEQMDANEKEIAAMHDALRASEASNVSIKNNLRAAEEYICQLEHRISELQRQENDSGRDHGSVECSLSEEVGKLTVENADLQQQIEDLNSALAYTNEELSSLKHECEQLRENCRHIKLKSLQADDLEDACKIWESKFLEMEARSAQFEGFSAAQKLEIERLTDNLNTADAAVNQFKLNASLNGTKLQQLEKTLAQKQETLISKEYALKQALQQVEDLRRLSDSTRDDAITEMSRKVDELSLRLRESQSGAKSMRNRFVEVEAAFESTKEELERTKATLSIAEEALRSMEREMDSSANQVPTKSTLEDTIVELKEALALRDNAIQQGESQRALLEDRLNAMVGELEKEQERAVREIEQRNADATSRDHEIEALKADYRLLRGDKESSVAESRSKIESILQEMGALRLHVQKTERKIASLEKQVESLTLELSTTNNMLLLKDEELQRVSLELEDNRAAQLEATQRVTSNILQSDMSKSEAESADNMRKLVITLSQALEKSESQRADAIDRLLRERKTNADSLKRLGESVKRFYTTLNGASP